MLGMSPEKMFQSKLSLAQAWSIGVSRELAESGSLESLRALHQCSEGGRNGSLTRRRAEGGVERWNRGQWQRLRLVQSDCGFKAR
jgi:hypothetical protein